MAQSTPPELLSFGLHKCRAYANYAQLLMSEREGGPPTPLIPNVSTTTVAELEAMVTIVREAWSARELLGYALSDVSAVLQQGKSGMTRDQLLRDTFQGPFPPRPDGSLQLINKPMAFVDEDNKAVAWYLPGIFSPQRCEQVLRTVRLASEAEDSAIHPGNGYSLREQGYANPHHCTIQPGCLNMSACWHPTGHKPPKSTPGPSSCFMEGEAAHHLLEDLVEINALISALLVLIHPELWKMQFQVLLEMNAGRVKVKHQGILTAVLDWWSTPFTAFALITNRETPFHRDNKGGRYLLDILSVFGDYNKGRLEVPLLGARFSYSPGTACALPGFLLEHGASKTDGERICIASFMRPDVGQGVLKTYKEVPLPSADALAEKWKWGYVSAGREDIWNMSDDEQ